LLQCNPKGGAAEIMLARYKNISFNINASLTVSINKLAIDGKHAHSEVFAEINSV